MKLLKLTIIGTSLSSPITLSRREEALGLFNSFLGNTKFMKAAEIMGLAEINEYFPLTKISDYLNGNSKEGGNGLNISKIINNFMGGKSDKDGADEGEEIEKATLRSTNRIDDNDNEGDEFELIDNTGDEHDER